jgi:hypothetical protein
MGLCRTINDRKPDPFFMIDNYRYHDKYPITKNKEWFEFANVSVQDIIDEFALI